MIDYIVVSLSDAIDVLGIETVNESFKSFSCEEEKDLEVFLCNKAIDYERSGKGKTYLVVDANIYETEQHLSIVAYYTLANTAIDLSNFPLIKRERLSASTLIEIRETRSRLFS